MRLSLVIPCYNEAANLPLLLKRCKHFAAMPEVEVIVVDNGSTDDSQRVLAQLLPLYPGCSSVRVEKNQGYGHGIDIRREGNDDFIYLSPNNFGLPPEKWNKAQKLTVKGDVVWEGGPPPQSHRYDKGESFNPTNISFCPDGGWHVGDGYGSNFLHRYDAQGNYLCTFGGGGKEKGQLATPHGHWFDGRNGIPKVAVCDRGNHRIQYFSLDGQILSGIPDIVGPASLDTRGDVMVCTEVFIGRLAFLDPEGRVLARLNDDPAWIKTIKETSGFRGLAHKDKWLPGKFVHPHDATFDQQGNLFVTEWVTGGRLTKLRHVA